MADLAGPDLSHLDDENDRGRPFDADSLSAISALAEDWGNRMLASGDANACAIGFDRNARGYAPSVGLLRLLKRLLDEDLRRYRAFRDESKGTERYGRSKVADEAQHQ